MEAANFRNKFDEWKSLLSIHCWNSHSGLSSYNSHNIRLCVYLGIILCVMFRISLSKVFRNNSHTKLKMKAHKWRQRFLNKVFIFYVFEDQHEERNSSSLILNLIANETFITNFVLEITYTTVKMSLFAIVITTGK